MATDTCQYPSVRCCPNPPLEGDKNNYCIFHSRQDGKDKEAFWKGIQDKLNNEDFDFEGYYFLPNLVADFRGKEFKDASFVKVIFKGDVDFSDAKFSGEFTGFIMTTFSGKLTSFSRARFSGKYTGFGSATFLGEHTSFEWAEFSGGLTDFGLAKFFGNRTNFNGARFSGACTFDSAEFSGELTDFSQANFYWCVRTLFADTVFGGECKFLEVELPLRPEQFVIFRGTRYPIDLSKTVFLYCNNYDRILFRNCRFSEGQDEVFGRKFPFWKRRVILNDELFVGKKLELRIQGKGQGRKETNRKGIFWEVEKKVIQEEVRVEYSHVESLYRQFKKNLEAEKDWETAGEFHYGEMECKRKGIASQWPRLAWIRQNFGLLAWYKYFSGYGERPVRAFCWIVFLILLFAGVYCLLDTPPRQGFFYYFWEMSIKATFLQRIGETGDEPIRVLGKLAYLLQSVICPTLIALFILALRRRVRR